MAFQMTTKQRGDVVVVELKGTLDTLAADDLKMAFDQVLRTGQKHIVLSLKGVTYVASSAIRVLLFLGKKLNKGQGGLKIAEVLPNVDEVFRMVGLGNAIPIFGSLSDALAGSSSPE